MFNNKKRDDIYEIKLHESEPKKHVFSELASQTQNYPPRIGDAPRKRSSDYKNSVKDLAQRVGVSAAIFIALFLFMNWPSYSQIIDSKIQQFTGDSKVSVLQELIDEEDMDELTMPETLDPVEEQKSSGRIFKLVKQFKAPEAESKENLLKINKDPKLEKNNIPQLDMEIRPPDTRLIIPRLNKNVPIVQIRPENLIKRDWDALEDDMMEALRYGVVHFPGTAMPGEHGNIALTGHSSYFPWDSGRFKDVFALLHDVEMGDNILLYHKQQKYIYEVTSIKTVKPEEIDVLEPTNDDRLTLITCTPVGTDINRLIVTAKLIKVS